MCVDNDIENHYCLVYAKRVLQAFIPELRISGNLQIHTFRIGGKLRELVNLRNYFLALV